ncbi:Rubrerythrin [uncultured Caudovirales phage]|uniref:Rubrerythrin n=1 Tax=uncultured Caudovirales phage TaxID=2100421 RepID=A0A6J5LFZ7_9CAUD|nr:Rubrerythrin [uncultured Caudovirales phage]
MIDELINQTSFDLSDPFDLRQDIFSPQFKKLNSYNDFLKEFYLEFLVWAYNGEVQTTIAYPLILENIRKNNYKHYFDGISEEETITLSNYFVDMVKEEQEHSLHFFNILKNMYGEELIQVKSDSPEKKLNLAESIEHNDFIKLLITYYTGECYLWTIFYKIYKQTHNENIRKVFKKLLVEEAQHNNKIYKLLKKISKNVQIDKTYFAEVCKSDRYFGLDFVKKKFVLADNNDKKTEKTLKLLYNNDWSRDFTTILTKKWYQLFEVLYPTISLEEFTKLIYQNNTINT